MTNNASIQENHPNWATGSGSNLPASRSAASASRFLGPDCFESRPSRSSCFSSDDDDIVDRCLSRLLNIEAPPDPVSEGRTLGGQTWQAITIGGGWICRTNTFVFKQLLFQSRASGQERGAEWVVAKLGPHNCERGGGRRPPTIACFSRWCRFRSSAVLYPSRLNERSPFTGRETGSLFGPFGFSLRQRQTAEQWACPPGPQGTVPCSRRKGCFQAPEPSPPRKLGQSPVNGYHESVPVLSLPSIFRTAFHKFPGYWRRVFCRGKTRLLAGMWCVLTAEELAKRGTGSVCGGSASRPCLYHGSPSRFRRHGAGAEASEPLFGCFQGTRALLRPNLKNAARGLREGCLPSRLL